MNTVITPDTVEFVTIPGVYPLMDFDKARVAIEREVPEEVLEAAPAWVTKALDPDCQALGAVKAAMGWVEGWALMAAADDALRIIEELDYMIHSEEVTNRVKAAARTFRAGVCDRRFELCELKPLRRALEVLNRVVRDFNRDVTAAQRASVRRHGGRGADARSRKAAKATRDRAIRAAMQQPKGQKSTPYSKK
jgi:hypothetical protein